MDAKHILTFAAGVLLGALIVLVTVASEQAPSEPLPNNVTIMETPTTTRSYVPCQQDDSCILNGH